MQALPTSDVDQHIYVHMSWAGFEQFLALRGDAACPRLTYLDGVLELMSPSETHEGIKSRLGRLLELWAAHEGIDLAAFGSTTLKHARSKTGIEPDECYVIGRAAMQGRPDLAIEVTVSSGGFDKLDAYYRLAVPEVWLWEDDRLRVFVWRKSGYVRRARSVVLQTLDLRFFAPFVADPDQPRAVRNFMAALRRN